MADGMISLKRDDDDDRDDYEKMATAPMQATLPDYPWGMCIHLDPETVAKLGFDTLPAPETVFVLNARAVVTRAEVPAGAPDQKCCDLQITDIQFTKEGK